MISRWHGAVCAAAVVALLGGCAGDAGRAGTNAQFINGGTTDSTHTNVVGIVIFMSNGTATCSGSLIAPNLVLTARHCVSPLSSEEFVCQTYTDSSGTHPTTTASAPFSARSFFVTTQTNMPQGQSGYTGVSQVIVPPNSTGVSLCGRDIALLRLSTPITNVTPAIPRLDIAPTIGEQFTAVGYGATNGSGSGAGTRRSRSGLSIDYVGRASAMGVQVLAEQEMAGNDGTCQGDSGGPPLDDAGWVFGVLSRGAANSCGQEVYTRVDSYSAWIREQAQAAASVAGLPVPSWVTPDAPGGTAFGQPCSSETSCMGDQSCLVIGSSRICSNLNCSECPGGWICGTDSQSNPACVPDPNVTPPPPEDSGTPPPEEDAATPPPEEDSGTGTTNPPASGSGSCTASPRARGPAGAFGLALSAVVGVVAARRRRRRAPR